VAGHYIVLSLLKKEHLLLSHTSQGAALKTLSEKENIFFMVNPRT